MKQQSSADKFHRRRVAMEKANKAKKDKFFEHDLRLDESGGKDEDQIPGVTPDSSTNPEEMIAAEKAALDALPDTRSPTSSESSTDRTTTMKSMVHVSKTPKSNSKTLFKKQQTSRKKLLKKLRRLQQLQSLHPGMCLPAGFRQLPQPPPPLPPTALRYGPTGKQCCCQCACTGLNNNHLKFLPRQQHHPLQQQYQQPDGPEVLPQSSASEAGTTSTTFNQHQHHHKQQFYQHQRHNQLHHHPPTAQHSTSFQRRPAAHPAQLRGATGPFCMKEMHSVVR